MPFRFSPLIALLCLSTAVFAQSETPKLYEVYGGYTLLSNSFNGVPGSTQPLNGWDASLAIPPLYGVRFKLETFGYRGTNTGAPQDALFILAGGQFDKKFGRETAFVEGLAGNGSMNKNWGPNGVRGEQDAFAAYMGGGLDTPITRRLAFRVDGGYQHTSFQVIGATTLMEVYVPGLPHSFARIASGLVWKF